MRKNVIILLLVIALSALWYHTETLRRISGRVLDRYPDFQIACEWRGGDYRLSRAYTNFEEGWHRDTVQCQKEIPWGEAWEWVDEDETLWLDIGTIQ